MKRMWRASSCMIGSKISMSAAGKYSDRFPTAKSPKAKKESMHSP